MFRTALRNVLSHKARLLMTVLAVMLGVAFVSGTLVFTDTLGTAYKNQSAKSYDDVAVAITYEDYLAEPGAEEPAGIGQKTLDTIEGQPGVASVGGRVNGFAGIADQDGELIGNGWSNVGVNFAPGPDGQDPNASFTSGGGPVKDTQVALDEDSAEKGGYTVGDTVRVATNGPVAEYTVSGVYTTDDGAVSAGGSMLLFTVAEAQKLYLSPGHYTDVTVTAEPGTSEQKILDQVKPLLNDAMTAQTGRTAADDQAKMIEQSFSAMNQGLLAFAGISLFVGAFLIANTFSMLIAQRTKELALLRALGASRRQVTRSVLSEAFLVGATASAVGLVLGIGIAVTLRSAMGSFGVRIPGGPLVVAPLTIVAALGVGILITMFAAWLPARRAARIPPIAAMSSVHAVATTKSLVVRNSIGAVITLLGAAVILFGAAQGSDGKTLIGLGAFLALVGVIILIPLLSRPVIALVQPALNRLWGVSGKLAGQNAVRNPRRTGATASALAIGLTLVTGLTVLGVSVGASLDKSTTDGLRADYMISMANGMGLDDSVPGLLADVDGVTAVSGLSSTYAELEGEGYMSGSGVAPAAIDRLLNLDLVTGSVDSLARDEVLVTTEVAQAHDVKVGSRLPVTFEDERKGEVVIGGIYEENEFVRQFVMSQKLLDPHQEESSVHEVLVKVDGGASTAHEQALADALGDNPAIQVADQEDIRETLGGMISTMLYLMYGLLAMSLVIAVLGVVNTLAMSVYERQQEIGMLRAIGLDRAKVKRMIRLEAVVIAVFGAVIGVGLGTFLAWAIGTSISSDLKDYALVMPWGRTAAFMVLAAAVGVLASLWPARSAARLDMLTAIKTE